MKAAVGAFVHLGTVPNSRTAETTLGGSGPAGPSIADVLAQGTEGQQLLESYARDVTDTVAAAFREVTLSGRLFARELVLLSVG
ncbi:hypothetical protein [Streptomyces sp. MT206]|uniref:hypothetical protein n=1 Tax=Streptomyces sp. MT206 TaxID=3031407 RepID=UPI002FCB831A